jgi:hypothetical protein
LEETVATIRRHGARVEHEASSGLFNVNNELSVSVVIGRCTKIRSGAYRWKMRFDRGLRPDITIAIRMDALNQTPLDYYILPYSDVFSALSGIRLSANNGLGFDAFRYNSLEPFFILTERVRIGDVA